MKWRATKSEYLERFEIFQMIIIEFIRCKRISLCPAFVAALTLATFLPAGGLLAQPDLSKKSSSWTYANLLGISIGDPDVLRVPEKLSDPQSAWEDLSVTTHTVNRRWTEGLSSFKHGGTY